ncbi:MAG: hypothetical protein AB2A00_21795 [Myxococcota bacterium]
MRAITGISDHYGRAEFVTLGVEAKRPVIRARQRYELLDPDLPCAPYHHEALVMPLEAVRPIIARTRASVEKHCRAALSDVKSTHAIDAIVLPESPFQRLPDDLAEILASRAITLAADGMLYREMLASVAAELGLRVFRYPRRSDEIAEAAKLLGTTPAAIVALLKSFGREVGAPWRKEHQVAAASALRVLASEGVIRL